MRKRTAKAKLMDSRTSRRIRHWAEAEERQITMIEEGSEMRSELNWQRIGRRQLEMDAWEIGDRYGAERDTELQLKQGRHTLPTRTHQRLLAYILHAAEWQHNLRMLALKRYNIAPTPMDTRRMTCRGLLMYTTTARPWDEWCRTDKERKEEGDSSRVYIKNIGAKGIGIKPGLLGGMVIKCLCFILEEGLNKDDIMEMVQVIRFLAASKEIWARKYDVCNQVAAGRTQRRSWNNTSKAAKTKESVMRDVDRVINVYTQLTTTRDNLNTLTDMGDAERQTAFERLTETRTEAQRHMENLKVRWLWGGAQQIRERLSQSAAFASEAQELHPAQVGAWMEVHQNMSKAHEGVNTEWYDNKEARRTLRNAVMQDKAWNYKEEQISYGAYILMLSTCIGQARRWARIRDAENLPTSLPDINERMRTFKEDLYVTWVHREGVRANSPTTGSAAVYQMPARDLGLSHSTNSHIKQASEKLHTGKGMPEYGKKKSEDLLDKDEVTLTAPAPTDRRNEPLIFLLQREQLFEAATPFSHNYRVIQEFTDMEAIREIKADNMHLGQPELMQENTRPGIRVQLIAHPGEGDYSYTQVMRIKEARSSEYVKEYTEQWGLRDSQNKSRHNNMIDGWRRGERSDVETDWAGIAWRQTTKITPTGQEEKLGITEHANQGADKEIMRCSSKMYEAPTRHLIQRRMTLDSESGAFRTYHVRHIEIISPSIPSMRRIMDDWIQHGDAHISKKRKESQSRSDRHVETEHLSQDECKKEEVISALSSTSADQESDEGEAEEQYTVAFNYLRHTLAERLEREEVDNAQPEEKNEQEMTEESTQGTVSEDEDKDAVQPSADSTAEVKEGDVSTEQINDQTEDTHSEEEKERVIEELVQNTSLDAEREDEGLTAQERPEVTVHSPTDTAAQVDSTTPSIYVSVVENVQSEAQAEGSDQAPTLQSSMRTTVQNEDQSYEDAPTVQDVQSKEQPNQSENKNTIQPSMDSVIQANDHPHSDNPRVETEDGETHQETQNGEEPQVEDSYNLERQEQPYTTPLQAETVKEETVPTDTDQAEKKEQNEMDEGKDTVAAQESDSSGHFHWTHGQQGESDGENEEKEDATPPTPPPCTQGGESEREAEEETAEKTEETAAAQSAEQAGVDKEKEQSPVDDDDDGFTLNKGKSNVWFQGTTQIRVHKGYKQIDITSMRREQRRELAEIIYKVLVRCVHVWRHCFNGTEEQRRRCEEFSILRDGKRKTIERNTWTIEEQRYWLEKSMETNTGDCKVIIQRIIGYIIEKKEAGQGGANRNSERNQIEWYLVYGGTHGPSNSEASEELVTIRQEGARGHRKEREDKQQTSEKDRKVPSHGLNSKQRKIEELEKRLRELKEGTSD